MRVVDPSKRPTAEPHPDVFTLADAFRLMAAIKDAERKRHRKWVARAWRYRSGA